MKYPHAMVDLETLATSARAAIAAIAVARFSARRIAPETFYLRVDLASCLKAGLEIDPETVVWWLAQDPAAARELWAKPRVPLVAALDRLTAWLGDDARDVLVWGNDPSFDNAILATAYRACGRQLPWRFFNNRCYRTEKSRPGAAKLERKGTHHHALDDALTQARHLIRIWKGTAK
jgi:hypothetical protein